MTPVVYSNTVTAMKTLVDQTLIFGYENDVVAKESFTALKISSDTVEVDEEFGNHIKALWADPGMLKTWER